MSQVVLQPSANSGSREHYRDTIETPVDLASNRDLLGDSLYNHLVSLFPSGYAPMWIGWSLVHLCFSLPTEEFSAAA